MQSRTRFQRFVHAPAVVLAMLAGLMVSAPTSSAQESGKDFQGSGNVFIRGEFKKWHKTTLEFHGPEVSELDEDVNPFTDYRLQAEFTHESGEATFLVPGFFAADGDAGNSGADSGDVWRVLFAPNRTGKWNFSLSFRSGKNIAIDDNAPSEAVTPYDGQSGSFTVSETDKTGRDLRGKGRLRYVGKRYLQFKGDGTYFLKVGADAPETLLGYADFDNTVAGKPNKVPLKTWSKHIRDWNEGDPTWKEGKGKGLIGAVNYLSGKGCNVFSFLTYNAGGDGDNVWPFVNRDDKLRYDCSKLDQWGMVFEHGTNRGMYVQFKMQETEIDDQRKGNKGNRGGVPEAMDGGKLGPERKLYCRELIARFGHNLALNWNLGEENTQSTDEQLAMIDYIAATDPYDHPIVVHTFPDQQDKVYRPLIGSRSKLAGLSLQNSSINDTHVQVVKWVKESSKAGKPWVVAFDESGSAAHAQCPDLGYEGYDGRDKSGKMTHTQHDVRKRTLWGTLMGGGAGNEYYFGYKYTQNDLVCEDWRSRDQSWDYCRIAIGFFHDNDVPFWEMDNMDELVGNPEHGNSRYCLAKSDEAYVVYLPDGGTHSLDLGSATGRFDVTWFNPRDGGALQRSKVKQVSGGSEVSLGTPPSDADEDWVVLIRKR
ncbi:MAG: DUF5060 domain-containing protein [Planctomycetota bacterium]